MEHVSVCLCVRMCYQRALLHQHYASSTATRIREKGRKKMEQVKQKICWSCSFHSSTVMNIFHTSFLDKAKETRYLFFFPYSIYRLGMSVLCYVSVFFWSWGPIYISTIISHLIFLFCLFTMMLRKWKYIGTKTTTCTMICWISMQFGVFVWMCVWMCKCRCVENCDDFEMLIK